MRLLRRVGLSLILSLAFMAAFLLSVAIVFAITVLVVGAPSPDDPDFRIMLEVLVACTLLGTLLSLVLTRFPLKPVHAISKGIDRLSHGHFDVRLDIRRPAEFKELSDGFNRMAEELQSVELLRSDFANDFSHEFKTPIASIKGFAEELLYNDGLTEGERREYLRVIAKESGRLAKLSNDVLDLSRLERQKIVADRSRFDLAEQVRLSVLVFERRVEEKSLDLRIDLDETEVEGDAGLLEQAWINIIDNAVKFTPRGGSIAVSLGREEGCVAFACSDEGCGMDERTVRHAADRFFQGDESRATQGNGIGLSLVRRIVEIHEGSLSIESRPGEGTEVKVRLPLP